jgi:superfamily II DNA or RNA helicase
MVTLREDQQDIIARVRAKFAEGKRSVLMQMATGAGKTYTAAFVMKEAAKKGNRTLFLCNRRELIDQTVAAFDNIGVKADVIAAGFKPDYNNFIQVGSIDTIRARLDDVMFFPDLVIWDECRAIASPSWAMIREHYAPAYHLGLDATPKRLDRKALRPYFEDMVCGLTIGELIERGALVPPKVYAPAVRPDMSGVKIRGGEYDAAGVAGVMSASSVTGDIVAHYLRLANGGQGIVFCPTIEYSEMIAEVFTEAGIPAQHLDGNTTRKVRKKIVERYRNGEIKLLTNVNLFTAGFDVPNVSYIADASPTKSLANYMQRAGRGSRPAEAKTHYILADHAGNSFEHGLPHEDREWSLDAPPKRTNKGISVQPVRQCEHCYAVCSIQETHCPLCGKEFPIKKREVKEVIGNLVEAVKEAKLYGADLDAAIDACNTIQDFLKIAKRQGYKAGWAYYRMKEKGSKWQSKNPM